MSLCEIKVQGESICLIGVLNFTSVPDIQKRLLSNLENGQKSWQIDLAGIHFSDSSGVALLMECVRTATRLHKNIIFCKVPDQIKAIVKVSGLDTLIPIENNQSCKLETIS